MNTDEPMTAFIRQQPGLAKRLLEEHHPDEHGRCAKCSGNSLVSWPCAARYHAEQAVIPLQRAAS